MKKLCFLDSPPVRVRLMFSTDLGMTWHHVIEHCAHHSSGCAQNELRMPSVYFPFEGWKRFTLQLHEVVSSRFVAIN